MGKQLNPLVGESVEKRSLDYSDSKNDSSDSEKMME